MSSCLPPVAKTDSYNVALGLGIPPFTPHAISVSLPTWRDNVGYEEGDKRVVDAMVSGYPRFFVHLSIRKLAGICEQKFGVQGESCVLFPTKKIADACRSFLQVRCSTAPENSRVNIRLIDFLIEDKSNDAGTVLASSSVNLHVVLYPTIQCSSAVKQFWQHTGMGISSRLAEHCLSLLPHDIFQPERRACSRIAGKIQNKHYAAISSRNTSPRPPQSPVHSAENFTADHSLYLEERYGRNLPIAAAASAKRALRRRISGVLIRDSPAEVHGVPSAGRLNVELGPSSRGVPEVSEDDVFLYPGGMTAIWNAHNLALSALTPAKSACFGFPYTDTLKILQKWGPGCHFFGNGRDSDIDSLEALLKEESTKEPSKPPLLALFTEFPSNPLLCSTDLPKLRALADQYGFLLIIDETIGNFVNVEVLQYADIVVSSLTKIFSGDANVMGGSLVLNPKGPFYKRLRSHLEANFEDFFFDQDAIFLERNSRDFKSRIRLIDANTEAVCDFLYSRSVAGGHPDATVKDVFYPKFITREHYDRCRIKPVESKGEAGGGFGGLFSVTFTSHEASQAFFDALPCFKGPSLGTNFTLACPYTILAHFCELEWAAQYGVEEGLVRVSVGMEDRQTLLSFFEKVLSAAEAAKH